jgi:glycosyltransferase involved in cell wall biosynthesis/peptidoglycan/xylan/chitin deacetylase (PgdA/CDA1 family)
MLLPKAPRYNLAVSLTHLNAAQKFRVVDLIDSAGLFSLLQRISGRGAIVFTLHRVLPAAELSDCYNAALSITPESLDALLDFLARRMPILGLPELLEHARSGSSSPACTMTFDDGWEDNYRIAFPIFKARNIPANIFLATDLIGGTQLLPEERLARILTGRDRDKCARMIADYASMFGKPMAQANVASDSALSRFFKFIPLDEKMRILDAGEAQSRYTPPRPSFMTWEQIREMQAHGFSFSSHTRRHTNLPVNTREVVMAELTGSREKIRAELCREAPYFAYPNGMYSDQSVQCVAEAGFRAAFTTDVGVVSPTSHPLRLPRIHLADEIVSGSERRFFPPMAQLMLTRACMAKPVHFSRSLAGARMLFMIDRVDDVDRLGGTELQIREIISALSASGVHTQLCILTSKPWAAAEKYFDCPVFFAEVGGGTGLFRVKNIFRLVRWMRHQHFAAVQTFFADANLFGPVLAWLAGIPLRIGSRRNLNYWMSGTWSFFQGIGNLFVTHIIANAQAVVEATRKSEAFIGSKSSVLYNGLDVDKFKRNAVRREAIRAQLGLKQKNVLIGTVSNLRPVKGLHDFIEAARVVAADYPEARFVVIGEGPLQPELERLIAELGLTGIFRLLGRQGDVPGYLSSFDIAVHSSESEGFSNSVLEYLGAGLPVVATNVGGNAEALDDAGILVPPKDAAALAKALKSLLADEVRCTSLSLAATARATMFAPAQTRERLLQTYSKILQG